MATQHDTPTPVDLEETAELPILPGAATVIGADDPMGATEHLLGLQRQGLSLFWVSMVLLKSSSERIRPTPRTTADCAPRLTVFPPTLMLLLVSVCMSCDSVSP